MTLSKSGNPEVYVMDLGSKQLNQITNHFGIDTEPIWSADGGTLYFTSDRGGKPQIYQAGRERRRRHAPDLRRAATTRAPPVSADGKKIATAQGNGNTYRIALMDRTMGNRWTPLSPGNLDESPSFAPNASMLLYAAKEGGRSVLYTVSADGRARAKLPVRGRERPGTGLGPVPAETLNGRNISDPRPRPPTRPPHTARRRGTTMNATTTSSDAS